MLSLFFEKLLDNALNKVKWPNLGWLMAVLLFAVLVVQNDSVRKSANEILGNELFPLSQNDPLKRFRPFVGQYEYVFNDNEGFVDENSLFGGTLTISVNGHITIKGKRDWYCDKSRHIVASSSPKAVWSSRIVTFNDDGDVVSQNTTEESGRNLNSFMSIQLPLDTNPATENTPDAQIEGDVYYTNIQNQGHITLRRMKNANDRHLLQPNGSECRLP